MLEAEGRQQQAPAVSGSIAPATTPAAVPAGLA
jgi:hypothetical protein